MPRNFGFEWTERNGKYLTRRHSRDGAFTSNSPVWSLGSKTNRLNVDEMSQIVNTGIVNFPGGCGDSFRTEWFSQSQDPWQNVAEALVRPAFRFCAVLV